MDRVRKTSTRVPRSEEAAAAAIPVSAAPETAAVAARLVARAEAMGLIELHDGEVVNGASTIEAVLAVQRAGIGRLLVTEADVARDVRGALDLLHSALEHSPHPDTEWRAVNAALSSQQTAALVGVSESSARRYAQEARPTPDLVAARLHFLALLNADLMGSYNTYGLRRWYARPRRALSGRSPRQVLTGEWTPDDDEAKKVSALARSLIGLGAT